MRTTAPLGVICAQDLGWKTIRRRWEHALPLEFENVRFFDPESFQKSPKALGSRGLRQMLNAREAAKAALGAGCTHLLVATNTDAGLLPLKSGARYGIYMDAGHAQVRWLYSGKPPTLKIRSRIRSLQRLAKERHAFLTMSRWAAQAANNEYNARVEDIFVVPPPIDTDLFTPTEKAGPMRAVFVGSDFKRKGGAIVLRLALDPAISDVQFDLLTSHSQPASPNVHFHTGLQPDSAALVSLIQSAHVLLLPTAAECYGLAVVEALSCGVPAVVSNRGALSEIVTSGLNGTVVDSLSFEDFRRALLTYLNSTRAKEEGMRAREQVLATHSYPVHANNVRRALGL